MTDEILALALVFAATALGVWRLLPLLVEAGMLRPKAESVPFPAGGVRQPVPVSETVMQASWSAALLIGGIACALFLAFTPLPFYVALGVGVGSGVLGYQLPVVCAKRRIQRRRQAFEARLVDVTLALANGLRAGAALPQTLDVVARDMGGIVREELGVVLQEYRLGMTLPEALDRLNRRMPSETLHLLVSALRITIQTGGSLAEVLDKITDTIRQRTEFHQRVRTLTAQGRFEATAIALAPAVAFIVLYLIQPELMKPLVQTTTGWCALGVALLLEIIGFLIIRRITNIET